MENKPSWLVYAETQIGVKEIPGTGHAPEVLQMWKDIRRGGIKDDETAWCAAFVGSSLEQVGIPSTRFESAISYAAWGVTLPAPAVGCVVLLSRNGGSGRHVGFVVGQNTKGDLLVLAGNQDNQVCIRPFNRSKVVHNGFRWPKGEVLPELSLPVLTEEYVTEFNV